VRLVTLPLIIYWSSYRKKLATRGLVDYRYANPLSFSTKQSVTMYMYRASQEERSIFWEDTVSLTVSRKVYVYIYPIQNGFRDRAISLYSYKTVDKKEILRTVPNTGTYCSTRLVQFT
jgi:hypothetical protein